MRRLVVNIVGFVDDHQPGRVAFDNQCTPKTCGTSAFSFNYTYDLLGNQFTSTNGEGVTFTSTYGAGGPHFPRF